MLRVCAQPCAHIADLDEKEAKRGPVRCLKISSGAPAGAGEEGGKVEDVSGLNSEFLLMKPALDWWAGQNLLIREHESSATQPLL